MGTGGAFIAIADDATSASWNPAGMVQLVKPELSFAYADEAREVGGQPLYFNNFNYISAVYPFNVAGRNVVTSLNFLRLYDFYFRTDFRLSSDPPPDPVEVTMLSSDTASTYQVSKKNFRFAGRDNITGELGALSPAIAVQVTPNFALGFTYNFWRDGIIGPSYSADHSQSGKGTQVIHLQIFTDADHSCECILDGDPACSDGETITNPECLAPSELKIDTEERDPYTNYYTYHQDIDFSGENFNVGLFWKPTPRLTVGGVYRSEFTARLTRTKTYAWGYTFQRPGWPPDIQDIPPSKTTYHDRLRFPASYGLGLAFRYSDRLSMSADVSRIEWDRFVYDDEETGTRFSPVNNLPVELADVDPTLSFRVGGEYLFIQPKYIIPVRGGVFYDPEPARKRPDDYYGVAAGTGLVFEPVVLDVSYWYRWGNDVILYTTYDSGNGKIREVKGDINRQMLMVSLIVHL